MAAGKVRKILLIAGVLLAVLVLLVSGAIFYVYKNLDGIARSQTESILASTLGVKVTLSSVAISLEKGNVVLHDLTIYNPDGFKTDHAMKFGEIEVTADIASFRTDEPRITLIRIGDPDIIYERKLTTSNLDVLGDNASADESSTSSSTEDSEESGKSFRIDRLVVEKSTVSIAASVPGVEPVPVTIPEIVMTDLQNGVTPAEGLSMFLAETVEAILLNSDSVIESLEKSAGSLTSGLDEKAGELESGIEKAGDAVKGTVEGLGDLIGGKKKK